MNLGVALQLTNILRDIKDDLNRGRVYLPLEDLATAGCRIEDLAAGRMSDPVKRVIAFECGRARDFYQRAVAARPPEDRRRLVAAEIMRAVYFETLRRIERSDYDIFSAGARVPASEASDDRAQAVAVAVMNDANPGGEFDVAVIGAGFAGLSAAVRLAREGRRVAVFESRSRLGGRANAYPDRETGECVDNGQHILLGCYRDTLSFLSDIGALDNVHRQAQLTVTMIDRAGRRSRLMCPSLPSPFHLMAGVMDWEALAWSDRFSVLRMAGPLRIARRQMQSDSSRRAPSGASQPKIAASPGETVESWLIRNGQSARLREMLWTPLALAALNQPPSKAAAPVFARVLAEMFGADAQAASILIPSKPLDVMYAGPAQRFIESRGGLVQPGTPVVIRLDGAEIGSISAAGRLISARAVISAVPWFSLAELFQGDTEALQGILGRAQAISSSPILTVNLWFDREVMDETFIGLPGRPMQWVFDKRTAFGGAASHVSMVSSGASPLLERTNPELIEEARTELSAALPLARSRQSPAGDCYPEPRATFSLAPGQPTRPGVVTPVRGLYLAGDWIDTGLPATIESAVRSGHGAALAALSNLR